MKRNELISAELAVLFYRVSEKLGIPSDAITERNGLLVAAKPLLKAGQTYTEHPPASPKVTASWEKFMAAYRHLTNPFTPFNICSGDLRENAATAFQEARIVAMDSSNDGIVLPDQFRFIEGQTATYTYDIPGLGRSLEFSVWNPPRDKQLKIQNVDGSHDRIVTFHVGLQTPNGKLHVHPISFRE